MSCEFKVLNATVITVCKVESQKYEHEEGENKRRARCLGNNIRISGELDLAKLCDLTIRSF